MSGQDIVPDSSYVIPLFEPAHIEHTPVDNFHKVASANGAKFFVNVTVREEVIKRIQKGQLKAACRQLLTSDPSLRPRIHDKDCDSVLKDFIKQGDYARLQAYMVDDAYAGYAALENSSGLIYLSGSVKDSWTKLGNFMTSAMLSSTDGMIANFARYIEADAIATRDVGFALVANSIDVYMPLALAQQCVTIYDPAIDV